VTICKFCGLPGTWKNTPKGWRLFDEHGWMHLCSPPKKRKPFLRWYGPRNSRTEAVLAEPNPDPDTPAGLYEEPRFKHWSTL